MSARHFLDANVIVYAVDTTHDAAHMRQIARKILRDGGFGVSGQVVHEFYLTATRKLKRPLSTSTAARMVQQLCRAEFIAADVGLIKLAIAHTHRYQINYWDGAILAAAEAFGASILYSEDLNHGQQCGSVQILNPFLP